MIEAVIIGGGIAGCAIALELRERGVAVNVVEMERPGAAATGASAGMLAPQYEGSPHGTLFGALLEGRDAFPSFAERVEHLTGEPLPVRWDGMLLVDVDEAEHDLAVNMLRWQREAGLRVEILERDEALSIQRGLAAGIRSCLWLPDEGQVDTQELAALLAPALHAADVRLLHGARVDRVDRAGGVVVGVTLSDGRRLTADVVVVAAGAWSGRLGGLPRPVSVRPVRGHLLRYPPPAVPLGPLLAGHGKRYLVPRADRSILAGSTMDEVGFDRSITEEGREAVARGAASLLPELARHRPLEWWADLRPISADGLPIVGEDPELAGVYYATGYGRNGILLAPRAAAVLAALITGTPGPSNWQGFSPARLLDLPPGA
jgi:glycine oxidase